MFTTVGEWNSACTASLLIYILYHAYTIIYQSFAYNTIIEL